MSARRKLLMGGGSFLVAAGFLGAGAVRYISGKDEGTARSVKFWRHVLPVWAHYRSVQLLNRDLGVLSDEHAAPMYEKLHERYADHIRDLCYEMRGFYLKNAQMMSTRDDFVPSRYMQWMKDTQDCLPPVFIGKEARLFVANMLKQDLNVEFEDVFQSFDDEPLGVASIGQVHRAVLKKNGAVVAVKLQLPGQFPKCCFESYEKLTLHPRMLGFTGMERMFRADVRTLKTFCKLALPQHVSAFSEIERQFLTEFDYRGEASNLIKVHDIVTPLWGHMVRIPLPIEEYCSKHVLVMEYLDGVRLVDGIKEQYRHLAKHFGLSLEELEEERKHAIRNGTYQFKTLEEASKEAKDIEWMETVFDNFFSLKPLKRLYNVSVPGITYILTFGYLSAPAVTIEERKKTLDLGAILSLLYRIHAHEIFEGGHFNGDPHPGNILLLKDGRLGLIDYGQVTSMDVEKRIIFAKMIVAIHRDDKEEVARIFFDEMKAVTKHKKKDVAYKLCCFWCDRDTDDILEGRNIADFLDHCEACDPMINIPPDFLVAQRVSVLLRGMGNAFGLKIKTTDLWYDQARIFLEKHGIDY